MNSKWIIVMGVEEYRDTLKEMFLKSGIVTFSEVQVKGFRFTENQLAGDSVPVNHKDPVYSVVSFALTEADRAKNLMRQIEQFNNSRTTARPLHAFQINVEAMA